jgi:hypothetical protein
MGDVDDERERKGLKNSGETDPQKYRKMGGK